MKTTTRLIGVVAIAMVLSIAFSGVALACCPIPETTCTSNIETTTSVTCMGTVTEDESLTFEQASRNLAIIPPLNVLAGERYGSTRYSEDMIARDGYTSYVKDLELDTANSGGVPDHNLEVAKTFDYVANNGGGLTFSETVAMDIISMPQPGAALMCPFAAPPAGNIPSSCEYVEAGSTLDVTEVSATTHTQTISTAVAADITPIVMHYDVHAGATALTSTAGAVGSGSATMTVHEMEGRGVNVNNPGRLGYEVTYEETTTVSGLFDLFKDMNYESGVLRP